MVLSTTPPRPSRRWATPAAAGLFAVAVALSGVTIVRADDKPKEPPAAPQPPDAPKPIEKLRAEAEALRGRADKLRAELRADEGKPRDDAKPADVKPARVVENRRGDKPAQPFQSSDVRVRVDVEKLRKQIDEALAGGKTDEAKKLVDALVEAFAPTMPGAPPKPPAAPTPPAPPDAPLPPGSPTPPVAASPPSATVVRGGTMQMSGSRTDPRTTAAVEALGKALETTQDAEARAAMLQAIKLIREQRLTVTRMGGALGAEGIGGPPGGEGGGGGRGGAAGGSGFAAPPGFTTDAFASRALGIGNFGLSAASVPEALAAQLQLPAGTGVLVTSVRPESSAGKAGLRKNDVVVKVNGEGVTGDEAAFLRTLSATKPGSTVALLVLSKGKETKLEVTVPESKLTRPAAKKVRFETLKMEVFNGGVSVEAKQGDRTYKITGAQVGELLDNAVITITDTKTGKATTQSGTVLTEMDERDRAAVQTLLTQIRGQ